MAPIKGFQPACEACGWQAPLMLPTRRLALEAARDHEYQSGWPAKGQLSPTVLQAMAADVVKQRLTHDRLRKRRERFLRQR